MNLHDFISYVFTQSMPKILKSAVVNQMKTRTRNIPFLQFILLHIATHRNHGAIAPPIIDSRKRGGC